MTMLRRWLWRPTPRWGMLAVAGGGLGLWFCVWLFSGSEDHGAKRWKAGGTAIETDAFSRLVRPEASGLFSILLADLGLDPPKPGDGPIPPKPTDWSQPHVAVYSVPAMRPPHLRPTLRDLGDHGQAHAIDLLEKNPATEPQLWTQLQNALMDVEDSAPGEKDPFQFDRVLVATVAKGADWDPGDRMV